MDVTPNKSEITFRSRQKIYEIVTHQILTLKSNIFLVFDAIVCRGPHSISTLSRRSPELQHVKLHMDI